MVEKKIWGNITWYLFHTLSYKLKYDEEKYVKELFNIYKSFCEHLPCPICKEHAMKFISSINYSNIKTKDNLIFVMFTFHNSVNKNTDKEEFTMEEYNKLYDDAITHKIINKFIKVWKFKGNTGYQGLKHNSFSKQLCINNFIKYISKNKHLFD